MTVKLLDKRREKMKNVLIIIIGQLAAGKTTYGKRISKVLKVPFLVKMQ